MHPDTVLVIPNGFLRPICESDVTDEYVSGLNDPQVNQFLEVRHNKQTHYSVSRFIRKNREAADMILWGIWYGNGRQKLLVGTVRLHGIDSVVPACNIGICLFKREVWGLGLGTKSIRRVTDWVFGMHDLCSIRAEVNIANFASQQAFLRAGYRYSHSAVIPFSVDPETAFYNVYLASRNDYLMLITG